MTLVRPTWGSLPSISAAAGVVWRSSCSYSNVAVTLSPVYGLHILWPFYLSIIYIFDNTFSTNFIVLRTWMSVCVLFPLFLKSEDWLWLIFYVEQYGHILSPFQKIVNILPKTVDLKHLFLRLEFKNLTKTGNINYHGVKIQY